ncbi:MAG: hypothetical protein HFG26_08780, partial [Provencibacterium sp.]|nr:hypothetical protein [Provencibacterium sp.]
MDNITTPSPTYTPPTASILHHTSAGFNSRPLSPPVHLMQYDRTLPVLAVSLRGGEMGEEEYAVPAGAAVNVRMDKTDGRVVYNPALGLDAARKTAYIGVTAQMTACAGPAMAILEIVLNGGVAGTAPIALEITPNPVTEDAIQSSDEFLALDDLVKQAAESAAAAAGSAAAAQRSQTAAAASAAAAAASETAAQASAAEAASSQAAAAGSAAAAQNAAAAAAGSASDAAASAALAEQHAVPVSNAEINEAGHLVVTLSNGNRIDAGEARGPQGPEGVEGPAGQSPYEAAV